MRRNLAWFASLLSVLTAADLTSPPRASACQTAIEDPTFDGLPADGATDVPTNVVPIFFFQPWAETTADHVPGTFSIETLNGDPVESTARSAASQWFEIVPARPLEPNTGYRIRGHWTRGDATFETQLEFTTGAGPRTGPIAAPVAKLQHLDWRPSKMSSCGSALQFTCVALEADAMVAYDLLDMFDQPLDESRGIARTSFATHVLTPKLQPTAFRCIRLRTRAIDGTFSEYTKLCGNDAPVFHVAVDRPVECTNEGLVWPSGARVMIDEEAAPLPMRDEGKSSTAGSLSAAGSSGSGDPSRARASEDDPASDAKHVVACSVRPGWQRSTSGPITGLGIWLAAWALRRRRARSRSPRASL